MSFKESILNIGKRIRGKQELSEDEHIVDLNSEVEEFLRWNREALLKGHSYYTQTYLDAQTKQLKDLIEKIAVWYELRYPNSKIEFLMKSEDVPTRDVDQIMFKTNPYIKALIGSDSDINELEWADFYNVDVFLQSLSSDERSFFAKYKYPYSIYLDPSDDVTTLDLTRSGKITSTFGIEYYTSDAVKGEELVGLYVREALELFKDRGVELPQGSGLQTAIDEDNNKELQKELMLDCAMYRIIERGGRNIGPFRGFLFAKEFDRNISIPIKYSVDNYYDVNLRVLINEYLKAGGSTDLECYYGYFSRLSKNSKLKTVTVQDVLSTQNGFSGSLYTQEEKDLQKRVVDLLAGQIDEDKLKAAEDAKKREEVKQLRLQRKLEKSRKRGTQNNGNK